MEQLISVNVHLKETSQVISYQAENTYVKGPFFCILLGDSTVHKFPLADIWRVTEGYGPRQSRATSQEERDRIEMLREGLRS